MWGQRQPREPSFSEQVEIQGRSDLVRDEIHDNDNTYQTMYSGIPFDSKVFDDEKILVFFDVNSEFFDPVYLPLYPFHSRLLAIGDLTPEEIRGLQADLSLCASRCLSMAKTRLQFMMIRSLEDFLKWRITGAARKGFLLRTITEHKKTLTMISEAKKKRGILPF